MAQAQDDVPSGAGDSRGHLSDARLPPPLGGWLVMADPEGPIDLRRLFPDVDVRVAPTSEALADALSLSEPGLVVLMAPPAEPGDLQRVAAWLSANPGARAVLISPHQAVAIRLHALELGFEDAVDLSWDPMEVVGRLSIAGRRRPSGSLGSDSRIALADGVELDRRARAVRRDGRLMPLRPRELALLEYLALHPGQAFTRDELLRHVWHDAAGKERMVDVYVFWLRAKIEQDAANPVHLLTVRGSGYLFDPPKYAGPHARGSDDAASNVNKGPLRR
jgi:DNA-binding response OmpR family regulator